MEGTYNRVVSARETIPHETYGYFADLLVKTVGTKSVNEGSSGGSDAKSENDKRGLKRPRKSNRESLLRFRSQIEAECDETATLPLTSSDSLYTSAKLSDNNEKTGSIDVVWPEEKALRLKTLAEEKYTSSNLKSALKYAKRAHKLHPSVEGLPELLTALKILHIATIPVFESTSFAQNTTPDYYQILQVERFSHINTIKKQYKKLALILHPDKNPFAVGVLLDKVKRRDYDTRLRIAMQSKATEEIELGAEVEAKTFWTACSTCRLLHQFERKYLGHNLMCPRCKKSFKAMEVEEDRNNADVDNEEKNEGVGVGQKRVSARIREKVAKGGNLGIVDKVGLGVKRKSSTVGEILKRSGVKVARHRDGDGVLLKDLRPKNMEKVEKLGDHDGQRIEGFRSKKAGNLVYVDKSSRDIDAANELLSRNGVDIVESERTKRAKAREEETMTLSQMQMLAKKKKNLVEGKPTLKEKEVNAETLKLMENGGEKEESKNEEEEERGEDEKVEEDKENEKVNLREKNNRRRVSKDRNSEVEKTISESPVRSETERDRALENGNAQVVPVEKENEQDMREKRQRCRVSKYGNLEVMKPKTSKNHVESDMKKLIVAKKGKLEIMPVEDSDFNDFDKDRKEKSFKKGQVWAVYDDDDGMPRQYALIENILSVNPFEVTLSWLQFQTNGDDELTSWQQMGFHISCGSFKVSGKLTIKYLNLFSHVVNCERAAREMYRIYPKKGSVWALYNNNGLDVEERTQRDKDKQCYHIVVSLSGYSDIYGLSIVHLEKVDGFRTVFKRKEIGANAVTCLGKNDLKLFSHQIPAKKLSGEEASGLPKDCWELDPASLAPQMLIAL
ncbi:hypothetical protein CDL12_03229 [Handroanthus impetiginosus]|uniref:J domain-containing protein n=1 Tax=Handroanthus impetiginosus TaxID=429701 RepID=A0A2G9I2R5_9LAMI|nr:hypothetical protein CDL12_03229 [Handroanthus impetiginosus]